VPVTATRAPCCAGRASTRASFEWRRARDAAAAAGLGGVRRKKANPDAVALAKAMKKIERLEEDLAKHRLALEIAGKAHALLEMLAESATAGSEASPAPDRWKR